MLFDRQNRTLGQELDTVRDATAKCRFDVAQSARANDNHVHIVMPSARDDGACDGAFLHFAHDAWVDTIGVDLSRIPIIGTVGENDEVKFKRPGKRVER